MLKSGRRGGRGTHGTTVCLERMAMNLAMHLHISFFVCWRHEVAACTVRTMEPAGDSRIQYLWFLHGASARDWCPAHVHRPRLPFPVFIFVSRPQDPTVGWGRSGRAQRSTTGETGDGDLSGDGEEGRGDLGRESENEDADRWVPCGCGCSPVKVRALYVCARSTPLNTVLR